MPCWLPDPKLVVTEQNEIVIRLVHNGTEVGGFNMTRFVSNLLDYVTKPKADVIELRKDR